jgi:hypothetical protein
MSSRIDRHVEEGYLSRRAQTEAVLVAGATRAAQRRQSTAIMTLLALITA